MPDLQLLGDARDPKGTLKVLRDVLRDQGVRQAVLTARPFATQLWRHGFALNLPTGWILIDEAFVSGNGGEGANVLNKALSALQRHLLRLRWTRATNGALTNDLKTALGHNWLEQSHLLAVWRKADEAFSITFEPAAHTLVIHEPSRARQPVQDDNQLSLWE